MSQTDLLSSFILLTFITFILTFNSIIILIWRHMHYWERTNEDFLTIKKTFSKLNERNVTYIAPFYNNINVFILFSRVIHPEDSSDWYWNISLSCCSLLLHIPLHFSFLRREIVPGRFWDWSFLWFHHARWFVFYSGEIYCYCDRSLTQRKKQKAL